MTRVRNLGDVYEAIEEKMGDQQITPLPYTDTPEGRAAKEMGFLPPRTTKESLWQKEAIARFLAENARTTRRAGGRGGA